MKMANGMFGGVGAQAAGRMMGEAIAIGQQRQAQDVGGQLPTINSEIDALLHAVSAVGAGIEELVKRIQPVSTPTPQGSGEDRANQIQPAASSVALAIRAQRDQLHVLSAKLSFAISQLEI